MIKFVPYIKFTLVFIFGLFAFSAIAPAEVHADAAFEAKSRSDFRDMPSELPDNGTGGTPSTGQYFVLGTDKIDNTTEPENRSPKIYDTANILVYTNTPNNSVSISLNFVARKVNTVGDDTDCSNFVTVRTTNPVTLDDNTTRTNPYGESVQSERNCQGYGVRVDAKYFTEVQALDSNGVENGRGVYVAAVQIRLDVGSQFGSAAMPKGKQAGFRVGVYDTSRGRLGYAGDRVLWNNIYGSLNQELHNFYFRWSAPCYGGSRLGFNTSVFQYDQGDETTPRTAPLNSIQRTHDSRMVSVRSGADTSSVDDIFQGGQFSESFNYSATGLSNNIGARAYSISGGNGFGINLPQPSSNVYFSECPRVQPPPNPSCTSYSQVINRGIIYRITSRSGGYVEASSPATSSANFPNTWKTYDSSRSASYDSISRFDNKDYINGTDYRDSGRAIYSVDLTGIIKGRDRHTVVEEWRHNDDGSWSYVANTAITMNCAISDAICDSIVLYGAVVAGDPRGVRAGQEFGITGRVRNTGVADLPENVNGGIKLGITVNESPGNWGRTHAYTNTGIPMGQARDASVGGLRAPSTRGTITLTAYADYDGAYAFGPACSITINVYQRFDFTATASTTLAPDNESPTQANHNSQVRQGTGVEVNGTVNTRFYYGDASVLRPVAGYTWGSDSRTFGDGTYTNTTPVHGYDKLGDRHCMFIILDRGHGWRGPGDTYAEVTPAQDNTCGYPKDVPPPICIPTSDCPCVQAAGEICTDGGSSVVKNPYVRVYGGDVAAGGGFGINCKRNLAAPSKILTFLRPLSEHNTSANKSGSGSQLAAMALGDINGFTSASIRSTGAATPNGLTFSHNLTPPAQSTTNPLMGGNMLGDGMCAPDFFGTTQFTTNDRKDSSNSTTAITVNNLTDKQQTLRTIPGQKVRLNGSSVPFDKHHTVYVEGDVFINGNIMYTSDWSAGIQSIPSFALIVKGNIIIDNNVTQLDGIYVAQPSAYDANGNPTAGGKIYTCGREGLGDGPVVISSELFADCGANWQASGDPMQLRVNGAFIAQKIVLNRTGYSIGQSSYKEQKNTTMAAEIFNFTPESYLSPPVFRANSTSTSGDYDYISILAPLL